MNKGKQRSMRHELSRYILSLSAGTAIAIFVTLNIYFERGLESAAESTMLMEARSFEIEYLKDKNTPLPSSYNMLFFIDNWDKAPAFYRQTIPINELEVGQFTDAEYTPNGEEEWKDSRYLITYWHKLPDQRDLFLVTDFKANLLTEEEQHAFDNMFVRIFYFIGSFLALMLFAVWFYNRRINKHTQHLSLWAESITLDNIQNAPPNFRYKELNDIAQQLQLSYEKNADLLDREHQFLRHASHELRTPIAITKANLELLNKVGIPATLAPSFERISRANNNMQQLTETLLWLSRDTAATPNIKAIDLSALCEETLEELAYLLEGKEVQLVRDFALTQDQIPLPETPLKIVLSNLIRNAFQYTYEGKISISLSDKTLIIENIDHGTQAYDTDNSFGLGLMLVKKICERLQWELTLHFGEFGVKAILRLPIAESGETCSLTENQRP